MANERQPGKSQRHGDGRHPMALKRAAAKKRKEFRLAARKLKLECRKWLWHFMEHPVYHAAAALIIVIVKSDVQLLNHVMI